MIRRAKRQGAPAPPSAARLAALPLLLLFLAALFLPARGRAEPAHADRAETAVASPREPDPVPPAQVMPLDPFDATVAWLDRGEASAALRSFHRGRDLLLRRGVGGSPEAAARLFRAALSRPSHEDALLSFAERLSPDPRRTLALAWHRLAARRPLDSSAAFARFLGQIARAPWNVLLFHLLFLAALAAALAAIVRVFARLYLYRRALLHEHAETGIPLHRLDPDRLARLPDRNAKDGLYLAAALLVLALFLLLPVAVGPAARLSRALALARQLLSAEPGALSAERLLADAHLPEGTEACLAGFENLRAGAFDRAREAFLLVERDAPFHPAALYGLACAEHLAGSSEAALRRLLPLCAGRDEPDLLLAVYTAARAAGNEAAAQATAVRLEATPGGRDRMIDLTLAYVGRGGVPPIPLAGDGATLLPPSATRPGFAAAALALAGILSGLASLHFARSVFEPEPGDLAPRFCAACGKISCDRCRATLGLCPRCLSPLPPGLSPQVIRARQLPRDGPPSLLLSTVLLGFTAHLAGRHRLASALAFFGYLALFLSRATAALADPGLAQEPSTLLSALAGTFRLAFFALLLAQFAAGFLSVRAAEGGPPRGSVRAAVTSGGQAGEG